MFSLHVKHFFEKFVKKVSRKFLSIDLERKRAELFLVLPFLSMEITENYRCQGQSTHHLPQSM
jgi:hypothetical protein